MKRERPAVVEMIAILNFIFGGIATICGVSTVVFSAMPPACNDPWFEKILVDYIEFQQRHIPGLLLFQLGSGLSRLAIGLTLIVTSVGLLRLHRWAYCTTIACAYATMILYTSVAIFELAIVLPVIDLWNAPPQLYKLNAGAQRISMIVRVVAYSGVFCAHAIAVLIVLMLPSVRAAFARPQCSLHDDFTTDKNKEYA
jgi:hypothetical protein